LFDKVQRKRRRKKSSSSSSSDKICPFRRRRSVYVKNSILTIFECVLSDDEDF
jgi:hypothetical protein